MKEVSHSSIQTQNEHEAQFLPLTGSAPFHKAPLLLSLSCLPLLGHDVVQCFCDITTGEAERAERLQIRQGEKSGNSSDGRWEQEQNCR